MRDACSNICFVDRLIRNLFWRLFLMVAIVIANGCCNIMERSEGTYTTMGMKYGSPYFCAKYPYHCTATVVKDCLAAPYSWLSDDYADWGEELWIAFATLTYPLWIADEVCEIVLDTVFLPCDIYAASVKE